MGDHQPRSGPSGLRCTGDREEKPLAILLVGEISQGSTLDDKDADAEELRQGDRRESTASTVRILSTQRRGAVAYSQASLGLCP